MSAELARINNRIDDLTLSASPPPPYHKLAPFKTIAAPELKPLRASNATTTPPTTLCSSSAFASTSACSAAPRVPISPSSPPLLTPRLSRQITPIHIKPCDSLTQVASQIKQHVSPSLPINLPTSSTSMCCNSRAIHDSNHTGTGKRSWRPNTKRRRDRSLMIDHEVAIDRPYLTGRRECCRREVGKEVKPRERRKVEDVPAYRMMRNTKRKKVTYAEEGQGWNDQAWWRKRGAGLRRLLHSGGGTGEPPDLCRSEETARWPEGAGEQAQQNSYGDPFTLTSLPSQRQACPRHCQSRTEGRRHSQEPSYSHTHPQESRHQQRRHHSTSVHVAQQNPHHPLSSSPPPRTPVDGTERPATLSPDPSRGYLRDTTSAALRHACSPPPSLQTHTHPLPAHSPTPPSLPHTHTLPLHLPPPPALMTTHDLPPPPDYYPRPAPPPTTIRPRSPPKPRWQYTFRSEGLSLDNLPPPPHPLGHLPDYLLEENQHHM